MLRDFWNNLNLFVFVVNVFFHLLLPKKKVALANSSAIAKREGSIPYAADMT